MAPAEVAGRLERGMLRTVAEFSGCTACGRVSWRGAHAHGIDDVVDAAVARVQCLHGQAGA